MSRFVFVNRYFHPDHSATSQLLSDLAFAAARDGGEVHVVTSRQRYDDPAARLPREEQIDGVSVHRVATTRFGRSLLAGRALDYLSFYFSAALALWRLTHRGDVVIAKTDPPLISVVAAAVARMRGAALINWVQDLFPEVAAALGVRGAGRPGMRLLTALRDWSLRAAARNVVLGDLMAERLSGAGVAADSITVVHNWTGPEVGPVEAEHNALRQAWGLAGKFVVAYSGNLGRAHDFSTILEAAALLRRRDDIVFLFIGGGARLPELRRRAEARGLTNILIKPYQPRERLAESLSVGDVHLVSLLPELEGLIVPSKVYGILAVGRPVIYIGSPEGEVPRLLARERCGITVSVGDGPALAAYLKTWAADPGRAVRLGAAGRGVFLNRFRQDVALYEWGEVLQAGACARAKIAQAPALPRG